MYKIFLFIFLLCINLFAREILNLSQYKEKTTLKKSETYYVPNVTNSCEVFGTMMNIGKITYKPFLSMLNLYETREEKVFAIANYFLAKMISNYDVITTKDICQVTMIKDKGYPKYIFLYPKSEFDKLKNRDFGKNDEKLLKIANESQNNNYNLPYPLIKTFKNIKVGGWDKNTNFIINKKATKNYMKFLDKFQFPNFAISMDENSVEDAYTEKEALNEYGKYATEKYKEQRQKHQVNSRVYITDWGTDFQTGDSLWGRHDVRLNNGRNFTVWLIKDSTGFKCYNLIFNRLSAGASNCHDRVNDNWRAFCNNKNFNLYGNQVKVVEEIVQRCGGY